jgi:DNA polymerase III alpha subunit
MEELKTGGWKRGQMSLFPMGGAAQDSQQEDWSLAEKVKAQEALLGSGLDAHPLELVSNQIAAAGALNTMEATARVGERIRIAGMRQTWRRSFSSHGEPIYFMALDDLEGMIDVVIFADVYRRHRAVFSDAGPYCLEGMLERDASSGEPFLRAERAWKFAY